MLTFNASLDGVRTIAIVFVLLFHTQYPDGNILLSGGFIAVELFFVLSGYLITALLLREHDTYGGISIRDFYIRRALRLFPALWLFLLTATVYVALQSDRTHAEQVRSGIIATFFYVSNWIAVRYNNPLLLLESYVVARNRRAVLPALALDANCRCKTLVAWKDARRYRANGAGCGRSSGVLLSCERYIPALLRGNRSPRGRTPDWRHDGDAPA